LNHNNNRKPPSLQASLEGHIDWVNDLALFSSFDNNASAALLATCSNDTTVRLWDTKSSSTHMTSIACLQGHTEYVMRLTSFPAISHQLVSGGLGGQLGVWDVSTGTAIISPHHTWSATTSSASISGDSTATHHQHLPSVYSLATESSSSLIAAGLVDGLIALLDPRSGKKVGELRGHGDMVRALVSVSGNDNSSLLSGSSDNAIKLWDLGTRRCIQTFAVHTDSVWALDVDPSGNVVYSGGKDGCVYSTQLSTRVSELLVTLDKHDSSSGGGSGSEMKGNSSPSPSPSSSSAGVGITALAVTNDGKALWTATASSSIQGWRINPSLPSLSSSSSQLTIPTGGATVPLVGRTFTAGHHPAARARLTFASSSPPPPVTGRQNNNTKPPRQPISIITRSTHHPAPQQLEPWIILQGAPALKEAAVCTDKRHIITLDEEEKAQLWDVTAGCIVEEDLAEPLVNTGNNNNDRHHYHHNSMDSTGDIIDDSSRPKRKDIKSYERSLFNPAYSIEPWFSFDTKLGCLALHLKPPQCFQAEVYAQELGQPNAPSDLKINYGEKMLKALFQPWIDGPQEQQYVQQDEGEEGKQMSDGGKKDSDEEMADLVVIHNTSIPSSPKGLGTAAQGEEPGQQLLDEGGGGGGVNTPISSTSAEASSTATEPNQSFRFTLGSATPKPIIIIVHPKQPKTVASSPTAAAGRQEQQQCAQSSAVINVPSSPPPLRLPVDQLGNALSERDIPSWVLDCIISNTFPVPKDMKLTFHLVPAQGSNLPTLQQSKLNAPKVLTISKAADYVVKKLAEKGIKMKEEPLFWSATKQQQWFEMVGREQHGDNGMMSTDDPIHHQHHQQQSRHTNKASGKTKSSPLPSPTAMGVGIVGGLKNLYQKTSTAASLARQNSLGSSSGNGNDNDNDSNNNGNSSGSTNPVLHLTCNDIVVPWDFSLAAVKKWIWKRPASEELRIEYSTRDPSSTMKLPKINLPT